MNRYQGIPTNLRGLLVAAVYAIAGAVAALPAAAAEAPANKLQSIDVQPLAGKGIQLVLTTSGP